MKHALANQLQMWGFQDGFTIFTDGSLGFGFSLTPLEVSCLVDDEVDGIAKKLRNLLNGLPVGTEIQFVQAIVPGNESVLKQYGSEDSLLVRSRLSHLRRENEEGSLPYYDLRLYVRVSASHHQLAAPRIFRRKRAGAVTGTNVLSQNLHRARQLLDDLKQSLEQSGLQATVLSEEETANGVYQQWNPDRKSPLTNYDPDDIRESLLFMDTVVDHGGFLMGENHHRVVSLKLMPESTFSSMARVFCHLPFHSTLFLSIFVPDQHKEMEHLNTHRRLAFSMAKGKRTGVSDLEGEAKFNDLETLLNDMVVQGEKVFHSSLNILLRSTTKEDLDAQVNHTLGLFRQLGGAEGMEESIAAFDVFSEMAVPNARARERAKKIRTSNLADLLPVYAPWRGHPNPRVLLKSSLGTLLSLDPFAPELSNFNHIVTGGSGSGKSFLTNVLLLQTLKDQPRIFIVDIGGSYRKLCENLGGQYIPFSLNEPVALNPFDLAIGETEPSHHKLKSLVGLVEMMTKDEGVKRLGKLERAEVEEAIKKLYVIDFPRLSHLRDTFLSWETLNIRSLGKILGPWCGNSPYGHLVDRPTAVHLTKPVVCFDLKGLESHPDLQAVCLYIITDFVWKEIQSNKTGFKFLVFDECWKLLESEAGAEFIGEVFRTFRKYFASAIAISQNIDDFAKSKIAAAILPNTSLKWILRQNGADRARLKEVLNLNDVEMSLIDSLHQKRGSYSQAFLMAESHHGLVQIEPTPIEYWLATTDPRDLAEVESVRSQNPDKSSLTILEGLAERFPRGCAVGKVAT